MRSIGSSNRAACLASYSTTQATTCPTSGQPAANGYLKKQFVIDRVTAAGFELVDEADFNANPKDQPTTDDFVWRLPPSLVTSGEDEDLRAQLTAVGESNRMTLKFRKPE